MVGHEIGVLRKPITGAFDLDNDGAVKQPIEECGSDNGIAEDLAPFCKAAVRGEYHAPFSYRALTREEQIAAAGNDGR